MARNAKQFTYVLGAIFLLNSCNLKTIGLK
jgi:hypothetical protein